MLTFNNQISAESIVVTEDDGTIKAVTRAWDAAKKVLTLTPVSLLSATTTYIVAITGVCDVHGQTLAAEIANFTTA